MFPPLNQPQTQIQNGPPARLPEICHFQFRMLRLARPLPCLTLSGPSLTPKSRPDTFQTHPNKSKCRNARFPPSITTSSTSSAKRQLSRCRPAARSTIRSISKKEERLHLALCISYKRRNSPPYLSGSRMALSVAIFDPPNHLPVLPSSSLPCPTVHLSPPWIIEDSTRSPSRVGTRFHLSENREMAFAGRRFSRSSISAMPTTSSGSEKETNGKRPFALVMDTLSPPLCSMVSPMLLPRFSTS